MPGTFQQNRVIFGLLLAATLAVDAVVGVWLLVDNLNQHFAVAFFALSFSQLSVLTTWVVLSSKYAGSRWLLPFVGGAAVAAYITFLGDIPPNASRMGIYLVSVVMMWFHVTAVLVIVWLLKPTRICASFNRQGDTSHWQLSLMQLLIVMSCLAILIVLVKNSEWTTDGRLVALMTIPIVNFAPLFGALAAVQSNLHWLLRLALSIASGLMIAAVFEWIGSEFADKINLFAFSAIQAVVIWAWLEVMKPSRDERIEYAEAEKSPAAQLAS
jgi:hypothetical protein